jgi:hypothetical protein
MEENKKYSALVVGATGAVGKRLALVMRCQVS